MLGRKLKLNKDDDHEDVTILKPCFQIGPEVQLREFPTTGEEYLLKVIKERQKYATFTTSNADYSKFAKNQNCFIEEIPCAKVCDGLKPTIEWQNIQIADFSDVRMNISRLRAKKSECPNKIKKVQPGNLQEWKRFFEKSEPTLSFVLGFKIFLVDHGLQYITEMLNDVPPGVTIDYTIGKWIYALLACVRQPLLSETTCIIRDLARKCAEIRSRINPEDENAPEAVIPMNLFICIVGRYFRQYDLAD